MNARKAVDAFLKEYMFIDQTEPTGYIASLRLDIETAINELQKINILNAYDILILNLYTRGFTVSDIAAILSCSRKTIHKELDAICVEIAKILGEGYFDAN